MRKIILIIALLVACLGQAQILNPVKWATTVNKVSNTEYELISTATIDSNWHLYSQTVPEDGPIPTTFTYKNENNAFKLVDNTTEEKGHTIDDPIFEMRIKFFEDKAVFKQTVKLETDVKTIMGTVEFMACDDSRCLPPNEVDLVFNIPSTVAKKKNKKSSVDINVNNDIDFTNQGLNQGLLEPVKWEFTHKKISDLEYELVFTATIDKDWALYSQFINGEGPIPTTFNFQKSTDYKLIGDTKESDENKVVKKEPLFDNIEVGKYFNKAVFTQKIKIAHEDALVKGDLQYMTCNDKQCLFPPETPFQFNFNKTEADTLKENNTVINDEANNRVNKILYGMSLEDLKKSEIKCDNEAKTITSELKEGNGSLWRIFGLGFLGGLLALLTPCVFPMIPLTVSFFTKKGGQSKGSGISKALLYGFFIFAVYILLSVPFHLLDSVNPDILNEISTNIWLNVIFFVIFLFFAFSFFGYYELTLPSSWTNKTTQGENAGGLVGVFFMALTLALVSFSCTGPILGSLLAGSLTADGGAWQLTSGMAGFGVALGLPFALFAMFPNMMNALPKSGGWLNTTKVILGFLELALAFKFLSNADLVAHWNILKIEPFLIIWIIVFAGLALYLFGKIKFPHDSPIKKLSFSRIAGGILVAAFTIYLISGFRVNKDTNTFTSLTLLSGLAPPVSYSFLYPNKCPNNLECFKDLKQGLAYAKKVDKPVIIDFTGLACVNCRKMEEHIWPLEKIDDYLRNDYVLISLYVDDKKELPKEEQVEVNRINGGTRLLKNYGHKWAHFQTQFFQTNSQPYYVLLNADGTQILNNPVGYTPDETEYAQFLECGLEVFNKVGN